ncbi:hypothetical protein AAMO2058_000177600 [Amorphochlora amoebiformis]
MKRKLCVAISFMGNPNVVYLDEPTSGMDPYSRRWVWNLLRSKKPGRVVVLTTHFMDEAELLADRIAIMATGRLNCCGSALYLKSRSGIGYTLTTVAASGTLTDEKGNEVSTNRVSVAKPSGIVAAIKEVVPSASVLNIAGGEVSMRLPLKAVSRFPMLFDSLDSRKSELGIACYGIAITTLEEVFIQVCRGGTLGNMVLAPTPTSADHKGKPKERESGLDAKEEIIGKPKERESSPDAKEEIIGEARPDQFVSQESEEENSEKVPLSASESRSPPAAPEGVKTSWDAVSEWGKEFGRNFLMLAWKRGVCAMRDIKALCYELIVPVVTICLVLLILKLNVNPAGPSILLDADLYHHHCSDTTKGESIDPPEAILSPGSDGAWQQLGVDVTSILAAGSGFTIVNSSLTTSLNVSIELLDEVLRHNRKSARTSSYTANDTITLTVTEAIEKALERLRRKVMMALSGRAYSEPIPPAPGGGPGTEGDTLEGETLEGETLEGETLEGETLEGETLEGETLQGETLQGETLQGETLEGETLEGETLEEETPSVEGESSLNSKKDGKVAWTGPVPATILHNSTYFHALPIAYAELHQARLRELRGPEAFVRVRNHPLPLTKIASLYISTILTLFAAIFLLLPFCFLPGTLAMFWVRERELHVKHVHFVSGVTPLQYWVTALVWDVISIAVIDAIFIIVLILYGNDEFIGTPERAWATYSLVFAYGLSVVPLSMLLSFSFVSASSAQVGIAGFHFVSGFVLLILASILESIPSMYDTAVFLKAAVFRFLPPFVLGEGLINLSLVALFQEVLGTPISPWQWEVLGRPLTYLFCSALGYFLLVLAIDSKSEIKWMMRHLLKKATSSSDTPSVNASIPLQELPGRSNANPEDDVAIEAEEVKEYLRNQDRAEGAAIVVDGLVKNYPPLAVDKLSLLIPKKQCFGLLGVNGAGKSTTLKILTADVEPTSGIAQVNGISVDEGVRAIRKQLGYCPQFNPLQPAMTVTETLWLYARFKGLERSVAHTRIDNLIKQLRLTPHAHKRCGALSGGNKRKVSLAIALVGNPPVLFLDEPSSGMDPVTRRYMWDLIADLGRKRCVVLTTHSMEECEALCHRVGIMAKGRLRCLGTLQHLKNRHGKGYHLEISCPETKSDRVSQALSKSFDHLSVIESYGGKMKMKLADAKVSLSNIFRTIESHKKELKITDYSVSQSSLEQIFISMVREGFDEGGNQGPAPGQ